VYVPHKSFVGTDRVRIYHWRSKLQWQLAARHSIINDENESIDYHHTTRIERPCGPFRAAVRRKQFAMLIEVNNSQRRLE
jgi:hypothetical protein